MKSLLIALALLGYSTSVEAEEAWTCSIANVSGWLYRFTISPPEVISTWGGLHFNILRNDDTGLVAVGWSTPDEQNHPLPLLPRNELGIRVFAINKVTGEFAFALFQAVESSTDGQGEVGHGKCLKN